MKVNPDWLIPQWPVPGHVHAVLTTRAGGQSAVPFDSLNLGDHVGDKPSDVAANRAMLHQALVAQPIFLSQVHGTHTVQLTDKTPYGVEADGCLSVQSQVACTIMVADCLPVLLTNAQGNVVAAAHAGWRSLAGQGRLGIFEQVYASLKALAPSEKPQDSMEIIAWLGPCIGPQAFEVGAEVREAFVSHDPAAQTCFKPQVSGKWLADLQGLARLRLAALGVTQIYGNDGKRDWCTVSNPSKFFSYRRDGVCGRMAACIWLD